METVEPFALIENGCALEFSGHRYYLCVANTNMDTFRGHLGALVRPKPGEQPRRVGVGAVYGTQIFLPVAMSLPTQYDVLQARAVIAVQLAAEAEAQKRAQEQEHRRRTFGDSSIPEELHDDVIERMRRYETPRDIAAWLRETKGVQTSHASVARLVHRYERMFAQARLTDDAPELLADLNGHRESFNSAMDTLAQLEDHLVQRVIDGEQQEDPVAEQAIRLARHRATLADRRLRATTALLTSRAGVVRAGGRTDAEPRRAANDAPEPESPFERPCTGSARPSSDSEASRAASALGHGDGAVLPDGEQVPGAAAREDDALHEGHPAALEAHAEHLHDERHDDGVLGDEHACPAALAQEPGHGVAHDAGALGEPTKALGNGPGDHAANDPAGADVPEGLLPALAVGDEGSGHPEERRRLDRLGS